MIHVRAVWLTDLGVGGVCRYWTEVVWSWTSRRKRSFDASLVSYILINIDLKVRDSCKVSYDSFRWRSTVNTSKKVFFTGDRLTRFIKAGILTAGSKPGAPLRKCSFDTSLEVDLKWSTSKKLVLCLFFGHRCLKRFIKDVILPSWTLIWNFTSKVFGLDSFGRGHVQCPCMVWSISVSFFSQCENLMFSWSVLGFGLFREHEESASDVLCLAWTSSASICWSFYVWISFALAVDVHLKLSLTMKAPKLYWLSKCSHRPFAYGLSFQFWGEFSFRKLFS